MTRHVSDQERAELGAAVHQARASGLDWKCITALYGRSRATLWRYVSDHMKHSGQSLRISAHRCRLADPE